VELEQTQDSPLPAESNRIPRTSTTELLSDPLNDIERPQRKPIELYGLPKRLKGKSLDNLVGYSEQKATAAAAIQNGDSVFITGSCGTGKSHLAYGLMNIWYQIHKDECREYSLRARFLPAVEFFHELKSTYGDNAETTEDQVIVRYTVDDLLVIDDIGAEKVSDWSRQVFYLLIDRRYRDCRQTIITSNMKLQHLSAAIDDRIGSRISEMGPVIELTGKDWRVENSDRRGSTPR